MKPLRILLFICALSLQFVYSKAEEITINGIIYSIEYRYGYDNRIAIVEGYVDGITDVTIETTVDGYDVKYIGNGAFSDCTTIKSIVIPNSVTNISGSAFAGCSNLTSVIMPERLEFMGSHVFWKCTSLTSITIPQGVTSIGNYTFRECINLESVILPESVTEFESSVFYGCKSLVSIDIPDAVTEMGDYTFYECSNLSSVNVPNGVKELNEFLFYGCSSLVSINIPNGVAKIEKGAFSGCRSLISIIIPEGVTTIGDEVFYGCSSLCSIDIPESTKSIGQYAFYNCSKLGSVVLPRDLDYIQDNLFSGCINLTSVVIPEGVTRIGSSAFYGCSGLKTITIPFSVSSIADYAFFDCTSLSSIIIPEGVTRIEWGTFNGCSSLTSIKLPESLIEIRGEVFFGCENLTSITIPENVEIIGHRALSGSYISSITISGNFKGWKYLLDYYNGSYDSMSLQEVVVKGSTVLDGAIMYNEEVRYIVDPGMYDLYEQAPEWSQYLQNVYSTDMFTLKTIEVTADENSSSVFTALGDGSKYVANLKVKGSINGYDIMTFRNKLIHLLYLDLSEADIVANDGGYYYYDDNSFVGFVKDNELGYKCFSETRIIEISLPISLKRIGKCAFSSCRDLEKVHIPDGIEYIDEQAFAYCSKLTSVLLPQSLCYIGQSAFYDCILLGPTITIPDKLDVISGSFINCKSIETICVGQNVTEIDDYAFYCCTNLKEVTFNRKLQTIGSSAFEKCANLRAVSLPYSVESIGERAFYECDSLKSIKIPSMTQMIGDKAFYGCDDIENVYTYTVEPTQIDQNTFSCYSYATLNVPSTSVELYQYNTQWSQFQDVREFDEPYDAFYLNGDFELTDRTGRLGGEPDAEMFETSGLIVSGNDKQELDDLVLNHDGSDGASIIGSAYDLTGNQVNLTAKSLKVNIAVEGNRWYFFCFPFNVAHDSIECTTSYVFYSYDGAKRAHDDSGWTKLPSDFDALSKGCGYIFQAYRTGILSINVGKEYLNFTAQNEKSMLNAYDSDDVTNAGWNYLGNPFISYYDINDLAHEYDAPIVVWNGQGYDVYKPGDDDYQLKPFEAFFVQKAQGTTQIEFLPENRITHNQATAISTLRAKERSVTGSTINPNRQLVNITIINADGAVDRTRIVYSTKAAMDYEIGVDAAKFHSDGVPQIYTLAGGLKYAINERPMGDDDICIGFIAPTPGVYTLSVPRNDTDIEIYDNFANSVVDLTFGNYSFESKAGTFNDRFVIHRTGGVTAVENGFRLDGMTVVSVDGGIDIEGKLTGKVSVYNEAGMLIAEPTETGRVELGNGVYVIKIGERSIKMTLN